MSTLSDLLAKRALTNRLPVEEAIIEQGKARAVHGLAKYGVTCDREDLTLIEWLEHAKQEAMDQVRYLEAAQRKIEKEISNSQNALAMPTENTEAPNT